MVIAGFYMEIRIILKLYLIGIGLCLLQRYTEQYLVCSDIVNLSP